MIPVFRSAKQGGVAMRRQRILASTPVPQRGSWSFTYSADQYLSKSWGVRQVGLCDASNNAIAKFVTFGIAGVSPYNNRTRDSFGIT